MRVVQIQNRPRGGGGADTVFDLTVNLLKRKGVQVSVLIKSSKGLDSGLRGKLHAFAAGIYSPGACSAMNRLIQENLPDVVHVHDLYPLLPSVLSVCRRENLPVVMTCHNYRLSCPTFLQMHNGHVCERCTGGKEYWCVLRNCRNNLFESIAFALHNTIDRKTRLFLNSITLFIVPTKFVKNWLVSAGFSRDRIEVIPHTIPVLESNVNTTFSTYIGYVGRISIEKGIHTLISAVENQPQWDIRLIGDGPLLPELMTKAPKNMTFLGWYNPNQVSAFIKGARFLVIPSIWNEIFGMVAVEAMSHGIPVIASRIGGLSEVVDDGITGLLFEPGNAEDLRKKISLLWENPDLCNQMSKASRKKVEQSYNEDVYYNNLMTVYETAINIQKRL
jgi:glycosyltransferase involved in cell wall biosynthesis